MPADDQTEPEPSVEQLNRLETDGGAGDVVQARDVHGGVHFHQSATEEFFQHLRSQFYVAKCPFFANGALCFGPVAHISITAFTDIIIEVVFEGYGFCFTDGFTVHRPLSPEGAGFVIKFSGFFGYL
jgi:hypothetical protein